MVRKHSKFKGISIFGVFAVIALFLAACSPNVSANQPTGTAIPTGAVASPTTPITTPTTATTTTAQATPTAAATVATTQNSSLGTFLVGPNGMTLYYFFNDTPGQSNCSGACATLWPPFLTNGTPTTTDSAVTGTLGIYTRTDGSQQVTYDGYPLYYYAGDNAPGDTNGEGYKNLWSVVIASGIPVSTGTPGSGTTPTTIPTTASTTSSSSTPAANLTPTPAATSGY